MKQGQDLGHMINQFIRGLLHDALRVSLRDPSWVLFIYRTIMRQRRAARVRQDWGERSVRVPAVVIASITSRCNLQCSGCYARATQRFPDAEMSADKLRSTIAEAEQMGIAIIVLAGGEPLTRPEILDITKDFPGIIFPLFTNGLLIDEEMIGKLKKQKNVVPIISLEGREPDTDGRRGQGVYGHLQKTMAAMRKRGIFFGTSLTVTRQNFAVVTNKGFIRELSAGGSRLFFFLDYVPVQKGTEDLVPTDAQRTKVARTIAAFRSELPGLFVAFPSDEKRLGGCWGAGRGFVHISPEGRVEPCPAFPFSDSSLEDLSLQEALRSKLLRTIRERHAYLSVTDGGCALWQHRDWVASLACPSVP